MGWIGGRQLCMHNLDPGGHLGQRYHGLMVGYDTVGSFFYARLGAWQPFLMRAPDLNRAVVRGSVVSIDPSN
jgi:hypothetical protein